MRTGVVLLSFVFALLLGCFYVGTTAFRLSTASVGARRAFRTTTMAAATAEIKVIAQADDATVAKLGCRRWATWGCGVSKFPWTYSDTETCLLIAGKVTVTPDGGGAPVTLQPGDIATFPAGMSCVWDVTEAIQKHYSFS